MFFVRCFAFMTQIAIAAPLGKVMCVCNRKDKPVSMCV